MGEVAVKNHLSGTAQLAIVTVAMLALIVPAAGAFRGQQVYTIGNCAKAEVRPSKIVFACADGNVYAAGVRYSSYGGAVAVAKGTAYRNKCEPSCAQGHFVSVPATIRLFSIRLCDRRFFYTKARVSTEPGVTWQVGSPRKCGRALT
jgi:hypothetical protein